MVRRSRRPNLIGTEKTVYDTLRTEEKMKPTDLVSLTQLSPRSVRHALKKLIDKDLIDKVPDLYDLRSYYYFLQSSSGS